jgi:ABC-type Fe3+/spermidine/putrescine transport system ATPase subunit
LSDRSYLRLEGLTRRFSADAGVFDLSLDVARGGILALLGPSGSGKTTTLRLLGGFEAPDAGRILVDGEDVARLRPEHRRFGMVFQHYALFPHLDVGENVAFGLETRGLKPDELNRRVSDALTLVDLAGFERRPVSGLSGGQQQRVALARALAPEPRVLLLDEPLSNLDPALRERTRRELRALIRRVGITTVIVTHEQEDAFDLGDRVAVLKDGQLQQEGTPEDLYRRPANAFVGGFIGRSTWLDGKVATRRDLTATIEVQGAEWSLGTQPALAKSAPGSAVRVLLRPEALTLAPPGEDGLAGTIIDRRFAGASAYYLVRLHAGRTIEVSAPPDAAHEGDVVSLTPQHHPADQHYVMHAFPAEQG